LDQQITDDRISKPQEVWPQRLTCYGLQSAVCVWTALGFTSLLY